MTSWKAFLFVVRGHFFQKQWWKTKTRACFSASIGFHFLLSMVESIITECEMPTEKFSWSTLAAPSRGKALNWNGDMLSWLASSDCPMNTSLGECFAGRPIELLPSFLSLLVHFSRNTKYFLSTAKSSGSLAYETLETKLDN